MDKFLNSKIKNALCFSMLDEEKIIESSNLFNAYYNELKSLKVDKSLKEKKGDVLHSFSIDYMEKILFKAADYAKQENWPKAIICYEVAYNLDNNVIKRINVLKSLVNCFANTKQNDLTKSLLEYFTEITDNNIDNYNWIASMYFLIDDYDNTLYFMEKYINSKNPDELSAEDYNLLGVYYSNIYNKLKDISLLKNAVKYIKIAHQKEPGNKLYPKNLTIMTAQLNNLEECSYYWKKVLELGALSEDEKFEYAAYCIKTGDFENWHKYFYSRFTKSEPLTFPNINAPKWNGINDISNETLLIYFEQGFGDTILVWGYNERLLKKCPNIIWVVQDAIYPLLKWNHLNIPVYPAGATNTDNLHFNYYIPSMDIPKILNIKKEDACVGANYIDVREEKYEYYKDKYFSSNDKLKIGISFSGHNNGNTTRDIPIKSFEILDKLDNIEIYSLVKDIEEEKFVNFKNNKVINIAKYFHNFEDTAAVLKNLDLIITSDNVILNLAAALGVKTYALFNWCYEYRWYDLMNNNIGWYTTVEPFINKSTDDWDDSMEEIFNRINKNM